jgi:hypothetical protein
MGNDFSTAELRQRIADLRQRRRWLPTMAAMGSTFIIIALSVMLLRWELNLWTGLVAFVGIGFMQYRLVLASHEATHKTLLQPVWLNEAAGLFCASLVGVSLFNYRRAHLEHHKYPQSIQDDIDGYIYRPIIKCKPGWPRFWLLFTGNYADILTKLRRKFVGDGELEGTHALVGVEKPSSGKLLGQLLPLAAVQLVVAAAFTSLLPWWSYPRLLAGADLHGGTPVGSHSHLSGTRVQLFLSRTAHRQPCRGAPDHDRRRNQFHRTLPLRPVWIQRSSGAPRPTDRSVLQPSRAP